MKTYSAKQNEVPADWYVVDAAGKTLGRMASEIAYRLRGKHKPEYTPHMDVGDHIVVINARQVHTTGKKAEQKIYYKHSGYPGNMKSISLADRLEKYPERVIRDAVTRMLPSGPLGRQMARKLRIYADGEHPHRAQQPQALEI
jgi:large subunit ribosomal protein L13